MKAQRESNMEPQPRNKGLSNFNATQAIREEEFRQILDLTPLFVTVLGPRRERQYINQMGLQYLGTTLDRWRETRPSAELHPDDLEPVQVHWDRAFSDALPFECEFRARRKDGIYRRLLGRCTAVLGRDGKVLRWHAAFTDIEDRIRAEKTRLLENADLREYARLLNRIPPMAPTVSTLGARGPKADFPPRVKDQNHLRISDWLEPGRTSRSIIESKFRSLSERFDSETPVLLLQLLRSAVDTLHADHEVAKIYIDRAVVLVEREVSLQRQPRPDEVLRNARNTLAQWQVNRVSDYLEKNLNGPIQIRDLAALTRLSESYFSRSFKGSFGMAPQAYIVKLRMRIAQRLMLTTDKPLCQIALACGLSDQAHFSKLFVRMFGVPPGVWRRDRRGCLARS